uniref:Uncharacterized protein n=1 Tax=Anguilla anguilla TaxID=7936 RepID=A0A0E9QJ66_ANGAN
MQIKWCTTALQTAAHMYREAPPAQAL